MRKFWRLTGIAALVVAIPVLFGIGHVLIGSWGRVVAPEEVPGPSTAMVMGAMVHPTGPSAFLEARLDLAVDLYESGSIERFIVTGDGRAEAHDEPAVMKEYLVDAGVPAGIIVEDPGGYDTYDSCVRADEAYDVEELVIVSQDYHVRRAITICRSVGVDAIAVQDTSMWRVYPLNGIRSLARESLANLKMEWDLISGRDPEYGLA